MSAGFRVTVMGAALLACSSMSLATDGSESGGGGGETGASFHKVAENIVSEVTRICNPMNPALAESWYSPSQKKTGRLFCSNEEEFQLALARVAVLARDEQTGPEAVNNRLDQIGVRTSDWKNRPKTWKDLESRLVFVSHELLSIMNLEKSESYQLSTAFVQWLKHNFSNLSQIYGSQPLNPPSQIYSVEIARTSLFDSGKYEEGHENRVRETATSELEEIHPNIFNLSYSDTNAYQALVRSYYSVCERARLIAGAKAVRECSEANPVAACQVIRYVLDKFDNEYDVYAVEHPHQTNYERQSYCSVEAIAAAL